MPGPNRTTNADNIRKIIFFIFHLLQYDFIPYNLPWVYFLLFSFIFRVEAFLPPTSGPGLAGLHIIACIINATVAKSLKADLLIQM